MYMMWMYLLNSVLIGILCHLIYSGWQHRSDSSLKIEPTEEPEIVSQIPLGEIYVYDDDDSPTEVFVRVQKDARPEIESFSMSMLEAGMNLIDVMSRYRKENIDCIHVFYGTVSLRHPENEHYDRAKFNRAIQAVSIETFLSTAVEFCREAILSSHEIISVGCGDGTIEREVIAAYRDRFNSDVINITLVDPAHKVDYKYFPDLIKERPEVVGNCALLIIWPELPSKNDGYDIDAIRKLRPRTVLTVYEINGVTGSSEFHNFLRNDSYKLSDDKYGLKNILFGIFTRLNTPRDPNNYGVVDKYEMEQVVLEEIFCNKFVGSDIVRMVKLKRVD